jgi:hypothetical protein
VHAGAVVGDIGPAFLRKMPALSSVEHLMRCSTCQQQQRYSSYTLQWTPGVARQLFMDDRAVESSCRLLRTVHRSCLPPPADLCVAAGYSEQQTACAEAGSRRRWIPIYS